MKLKVMLKVMSSPSWVQWTVCVADMVRGAVHVVFLRQTVEPPSQLPSDHTGVANQKYDGWIRPYWVGWNLVAPGGTIEVCGFDRT